MVGRFISARTIWDLGGFSWHVASRGAQHDHFFSSFFTFTKSTSVFFIFTLGPGNSLSFHVIQSGLKLGPWTVLTPLELRRNEKQPQFWPCRLGKQFVFDGPFQWNATPSFPVLFVFLPPSFLFSLDSFVLFLTLILFFKFLSLFLAISRGGQRCFWDRQWNFSAFRFVCESKRLRD